jgi:hypothetical protein
MKKGITGLMLAVGMLLLSGCTTYAPRASVASPQFVGGHYYMAGDSNCVRGVPDADADLACYDENGSFTGRRSPMAPGQLQANQMQQLVTQQRQAANNAQMRQTSQQMASGYQGQTYAAPVVQGIPTAGSTTTYQQVGNTLIGSDGTTCQTVGQTIICK